MEALSLNIEKDLESRLRDLMDESNLNVGLAREISGGSINKVYLVKVSSSKLPGEVIVKSHEKPPKDFFFKEANGLKSLSFLAKKGTTLRVPEVYGHNDHMLVLEYIPAGSENSYDQLAKGLLELYSFHRPSFGFDEDNYIGLNDQKNTLSNDWGSFFYNERLLFQVEKTADESWKMKLEELKPKMIGLITKHHPKPSLVHGDLWNGNFFFDQTGKPVLIDPAVSYSDPMVDIAMTSLFGELPDSFYQTIIKGLGLNGDHVMPLFIIYNFYHILNHYNLFGNSYAPQVERMFQEIENL
ncbi:MAG: fructosamine kinase family protein [Bacteriovoracaceae bacterium]